MSPPTPNDGSEEVSDFLQRIKELGDKRDQEDEARNRLLEEEILKGRAERQARRAERARSISPTKSSPANTPIAARATQGNSFLQSPKMDFRNGSEAESDMCAADIKSEAPEAQSDIHFQAVKEKSVPGTSSIKENIYPIDNDRSTPGQLREPSITTSPSSAMLSRNSQLSWQQRRPTSSGGPRSRPLSMVATENAAQSPRATATPEPSQNSDLTPSREQIAQSLASKDPSWFRQTADRGSNSPAYRKIQVEDENRSDHGSNSERIQMPGMAQSTSTSEKTMDEPANRSASPSRASTMSGSASNKSYQAPTLSSEYSSPMPSTPAQRFEPPGDVTSGSRGLAMSPTQGRISPERMDRPPSPTKGLGGFVQSAMMKRSDSVSKRWSVQSPNGLTRANSVASRASVDLGTGSSLGNTVTISADSRAGSLSREGSPRSPSRPTSSHSNATLTQERPGTGNSMKSTMTTSTTSMGDDVFVKPFLPASRTQTPTGFRSSQQDNSEMTPKRIDTTPPSSPSKTMDPRRWSPTKSSWLESALNKPESPKPKIATPVSQQPSWMTEINKAKQKTGPDLARSPTSIPKHSVNIGGLMRSPPPGGLMKPQSLGTISSAGLGSPAIPKKPSEPSFPQETQGLSKPTELASPRPSTATFATRSSPAAGKVKPETPPKKDFRANLKPRQLPPDDASSKEPEFKNAMGQLRRTKTQNYVAPDELKDNITRGKAALNLTGGPKKTERKDEFKEAILKKKDDFKKAQSEGKGVTRSPNGGVQESSIPEALAKRQALGRSGSIVSEFSPQATPSKPQSFSSTPPSLVKEISAPARLQAKEPVVGKLAGRLNPGLAGLLARGPSSVGSENSRTSSPALSQRTVSLSASTTEPTESGPQLTHMTKGRARGPRRKAPSSAATPNASELMPRTQKTDISQASSPVKEDIKATPELVKKIDVSAFEKKASEEPPLSPSKTGNENNVSQPSSPRKLDMKRRSQFLRDTSNQTGSTQSQLDAPKPLSPTKKANPIEIPMKSPGDTPEIRDVPMTKPNPMTPSKPQSMVTRVSDDIPTPSKVSKSPENVKPRPAVLSLVNATSVKSTASPSGGSQTTVRHSHTKSYELNQSPVVSVKNVAAMWDQPSPTKSTQEAPRARSPIKLPTAADDHAAMVSAGLRLASPEKPKDVTGSHTQTVKLVTARPLPVPPTKGPLSPPSSAGLGQSTIATPAGNSPVPQTSEASRLIGDFFEDTTAKHQFRVDTAALLSTRPDLGIDIKTLRSNLYQLSSDGKKQVVPSHQERILFEGNMYLCIHTFGNKVGRRVTEVYFWLGDDVSNTTIEDAEIFARREAKTAGGNLITLRQGRETPEFFHALGGIIITRRGSSNKYDSLAPHILCGRKHFNQIAFDEVDFSPDSLCSGFPYLISTQSGKCYLWKGKGSGIEELSCARLIGMDLGLTGEIEEVDDGIEPEFFLQIFGKGAQIPGSADHWKLKSNYNKYSVRLFMAGSDSKEQVVEVNPFCWSDLENTKIYILDAFFEIYIIVGSATQSQYSAFQNALMFAQEYGILGSSMEDRPFVPVTTIVLEGVPKDMKSVFRKWVPGRSPTLLRPPPAAGSLQRWRSLKVLPLTAAIEATRR